MKKKHFVIIDGYQKGIFFGTWDKIRKYVDGYPNAKFKSFSTRAAAEAYMNGKDSPKNSGCYAVKRGRKTGLFETWSEVAKYVLGFSGAIYKKFNTEAAARKFLREPIAD